MRSILLVPLFALGLACSAFAQAPADQAPATDTPQAPTLHIESQAVLLDVLVTDHSGQPVKGLSKDAFTVLEKGKPQSIAFFEEHTSDARAVQVRKAEFPVLPPDVFSNFSPLNAPPAVSVLLLDGLNSQADDQMSVRQAAIKYLRNVKPGTRMAIFTLSGGMTLNYVQGFGDDPAVLAAALGFGKGKAGELSAAVPNAAANLATSNLLAMMGNTGASTPASAPPSGNTPPSAAPNAPPPNNTNAPQGMTDALVQFIQTNTDAQSDYSEYMTLDAFQSLAKFLGAFPGRKNLIWLSGSFPFSFQATPTGQGGNINSVSNVRFDKALKDTIKLLSAARVAVYPTDAHGVATNSNYTAGNALAPALSGPSTIAGPDGNLNNNRITEDMNQNISYANMDQIAESTGGKAIKSTNDLAGAISDAATSSDNFYTLSYSPSNLRLDDTYRPIEVKIASGKYNLTYRRGYYATNSSLPGAAASELQDDADKQTMERLSKTDPLLPFMKMGMPQVEQILYKALILPAPPLPALPDAAPKAKNTHRYTVQFAVDLKDLKLTLDAAGVHSTTLNLSMILFDKYGKVVTRKDHIVALNIKPSVYAAFQQNGVQLHDSIEAPDNNGYWLRTGVYDQNSHKVGTMEVNLAAVHPLETATVAAPAQK